MIAAAIYNLDDASKKAALSTLNLGKAKRKSVTDTLQETAARKDYTAEIIKSSIAEANLKKSQKNAAKSAIDSATATNFQALGVSTLTEEELRNVLSKTALDKKTQESIVTKVLDTTATGAQATAYDLLKAKMLACAAAAKSLIFSPVGATIVAIGLIVGIAYAYDKVAVSVDEASDALKELSDELNDITSDLESAKSELETTAERIKEINALGSGMTFSDKAELETLEATNKKLKTQIALLENREAIKNREANAAAVKLYNEMDGTDNGFDKNYWYGSYSGGDKVNTSDGFLRDAFRDLSNALSLALTKNNIYNKISANDYFQQSLKAYTEEIAKKNADDSGEFDDSYLNELGTELRDITEKYEQIAFITPVTPEEEKAVRDATLALAQFNIVMGLTTGGATSLESGMSDAFEVFSSGSDEVSKAIKNLLDSASGMTDKEIQDAIASLGENSEFSKFFIDTLGISIDDLVGYIKAYNHELSIANNQEVINSLTGSLGDISAITEKFTKLGDALAEFREDGRLCADTILEINEAFSKVDGIEKYIAALSRAANTEDLSNSLKNLAEAYISSDDALRNLESGYSDIVIKQLKSIGVTNAQEVVEAKLAKMHGESVLATRMSEKSISDLIGSSEELITAQQESEKAAIKQAEAQGKTRAAEIEAMERRIKETEWVEDYVDVVDTAAGSLGNLREANNNLLYVQKEDAAIKEQLINSISTENRSIAAQKGLLSALASEYGVSESAVADYIITKKLVKSNDITSVTASEVGALIALAEAAGSSSYNLAVLSEIKYLMDKKESAMSYWRSQSDAGSRGAAVGAYYDRQIEALRKQLETGSGVGGDISVNVDVSGLPSGSSSGSSGGSGGSGSSSDKKDTIDWLERRLNLLSKETERQRERVDSGVYKSLEEMSKKWQPANAADNIIDRKRLVIDDAIRAARAEISAQQKARQIYEAAAAKLGISSSLRAKIESGDYDIKEYNSDTADLIKRYEEFYDKAQDCRDKVTSLQASVNELNAQKLDNIISEYQNLADGISATQDYLSALLEYRNTSGMSVTNDSYLSIIDRQWEAEREHLEILNNEKNDLSNALKNNRTSMTLADTREAYARIRELNVEILNSKTEIAKYENAYDEATNVEYQNNLDRAAELLDRQEAYYDFVKSAGNDLLASSSYDVLKSSTIKEIDALEALNEMLIISKQSCQVGSEKWNEYQKAISDNIKTADEYRQSLIDLAEAQASLPLDRAEITHQDNAEKRKQYDAEYKTAKSHAERLEIINKKIAVDRSDRNADISAAKSTSASVKSLQNTTLDTILFSQSGSTGAYITSSDIDAISAAIETQSQIGTGIVNKIKRSGNDYALKATLDWNAAIEANQRAQQIANIARAEYQVSLSQNSMDKFDSLADWYSNYIESNYTNRIDEINAEMEKLDITGVETDSAEYRALLKERYDLKSRAIADTTDEYQRLKNWFENNKDILLEEDRLDAESRLADLSVKLIEDTAQLLDDKNNYWEKTQLRKYERLEEENETIEKQLSAVKSMIGDEGLHNDDGTFSDRGIVVLAAYSAELQLALKSLRNYNDEMKAAKELYEKGYITEAKYNEVIKEVSDNYASAAESVSQYTDSLIGLYKEQGQSELDALFDVIDARSEALRKKKEYYDYDKTIREKTKDIKSLQAEIAALDGVDSAETRAQKRRLEAELSDAADELEDIEKEHLYNIQIEGFDEMKTDLQDVFDRYIEDLHTSLDEQGKVINNVQQLVQSSSHLINSTLQNIADFYGVDLGNLSSGVGILSGELPHAATGGVVRGIRAAGDDGIASLAIGETVLTDKFTGVLPEALNSMNTFNEVFSKIISNSSFPSISTSELPPLSSGEVNLHIENLLNVEGAVDKTVVADLKAFSDDISKKITRELRRGLLKKGYK